MNYCNKCGTKLTEYQKFCNNCGNHLNETQTEDIYINVVAEDRSLFGYFLKCFKNYANFNGRARRKEIWGWVLFANIPSNTVFLCMTLLGYENPVLSVINTIYSFATIIPNLAVFVRRAHDLGHSGWWILFPLYAPTSLIPKSKKGANKYGPNPLGE